MLSRSYDYTTYTTYEPVNFLYDRLLDENEASNWVRLLLIRLARRFKLFKTERIPNLFHEKVHYLTFEKLEEFGAQLDRAIDNLGINMTEAVIVCPTKYKYKMETLAREYAPSGNNQHKKYRGLRVVYSSAKGFDSIVVI